MTLTLAAVFAPLAFTPGRTGRLFVEFALTLAGAVIVSGFVALTLTPMMCSKLLRHNPSPGWFDRTMERALVGLSAGYRTLLGFVLDHRWIVALVMLASAGGSWWLLITSKSELSPMEDRGVVILPVTAPEGSSLEYTVRYLDAVGAIAQRQDDFDRVFVFLGGTFNSSVSQGTVILRAKDWSERSRSTQEAARSLQPQRSALPGVTAFPITPPSLGQGFRSQPVNFVVVTNDSYENLQRATQAIIAEMQKHPGFIQPDTDLRLNKPELLIDVDRDRAADLGVAVDSVARTVETMLGGRNVTRYKRGSDQYDVIVQTVAAGRATPDDIEKLFVRARNDVMVPLSSLVKVREAVAARELNHFNQRRSVTITANRAPNFSLGEALQVMDATAAKILEPGYATELNGVSREFRSSAGALSLVFVLALVFIFLVLAAQFESFVDPFIILAGSVPLALSGALLFSFLGLTTLNIYSQVGLITLVGLVAKNGILIVQFANHLQETGLDKLHAVIEASSTRLRPILMTTAATVVGHFPLVLATGPGAGARNSIGIVLVTGMVIGTVFTLFVVPSIYMLLVRRHVAIVAAEESTQNVLTGRVSPEGAAA
jgi:multidrug efflux pump